jgi:hypothetical protein
MFGWGCRKLGQDISYTYCDSVAKYRSQQAFAAQWNGPEELLLLVGHSHDGGEVKQVSLRRHYRLTRRVDRP